MAANATSRFGPVWDTPALGLQAHRDFPAGRAISRAVSPVHCSQKGCGFLREGGGWGMHPPPPPPARFGMLVVSLVLGAWCMIHCSRPFSQLFEAQSYLMLSSSVIVKLFHPLAPKPTRTIEVDLFIIEGQQVGRRIK